MRKTRTNSKNSKRECLKNYFCHWDGKQEVELNTDAESWGVPSQCLCLWERGRGVISECEPGGVWVEDTNRRGVTKEIWKDHQMAMTFQWPQSMLSWNFLQPQFYAGYSRKAERWLEWSWVEAFFSRH